MLAGTVERVTYHNADTGFAVLRVSARGFREPVTVVGRLAAIVAGERLQASGHWVVDAQYGRQFAADFLRSAPPTSPDGIERYLASGLVRGIGPVYAKKLVAAFGERVFDVIDREPDRLHHVPGIGAKRIEAILAAWAEQKAIREIMLFLYQHDIGPSRAMRIYRTYGAGALKTISENPYQLSRDIRGIGFKVADAIAASLGVDHGALIRRRAALIHRLGEAVEAGHCGLPRDELLASTAELLALPSAQVEEALPAEIGNGHVILDRSGETACVFLSGLHEAETFIAGRLCQLAAGRPPWPPIDPGRAIPWVEDKLAIALAEGQRTAIATALAQKVVVITGGPGVGKTTLMRSLLRIVATKKVQVALAAPTGRAAKRLSDSTGFEAKTLHRLLEVDAHGGRFRRREDNPLTCDLLVVDEASMIDVPMMRSLLKAMPDHAALLLVGDTDQLPSVGPGQVLADIISANRLPVVRLTEVFRQATASRIIANAHRIREGVLPAIDQDPESDFRFIGCESPEDGAAKIRRLVCELIPDRYGFDAKRDVQVLTPMQQGRLGARTLNVELQAALNPQSAAVIERHGSRFAVGDKVMQVENDYKKEVFNGDVGTIETADAEAEVASVNFDGRLVTYAFDDLDQLTLAYAITIHKAQGSEYPAVVIPVTTHHFPMLQRSLIYTGVTRGRRLVVVVGQLRALAIAVKNARSGRRWTRLAEQVSRAMAAQR
ncbi:MAG: ATP-dependent RecD-like DNA helicase [Rhodospirillales bacterium]|nr:ATP-dependent RecD-like DNA helicase [Rhodospirillales bacterium]